MVKMKKIVMSLILGCKYAWAMSQKLPLNNFEWIEDTCQFIEDFRKKL